MARASAATVPDGARGPALAARDRRHRARARPRRAPLHVPGRRAAGAGPATPFAAR